LTKEGEGAGSALLNVLKHPITVGALGGGLVGGGLGYLAPEEDKLRRRSALVGAGTGAALGGLGGALASAGMDPEDAESMANKARLMGMSHGHTVGHAAGTAQGRLQGQADFVRNMPVGVPMTDDAKAQLLRAMIQTG